MDAYLLFVFIMIWVQRTLEKLIRNDDYDVRLTKTEGGKVFLWITAVIIIILLITFLMTESNQANPLIGLLLSMIYGFRAYMEWRYNRASNNHVVSLILLVLAMMFTLIMFLFWLMYRQIY